MIIVVLGGAAWLIAGMRVNTHDRAPQYATRHDYKKTEREAGVE
ncbi:MAG TPA: hypothetical protein VFC92_02115 [Bacteroidales bacterium]|nr:hypothetical protein [Bacteroidales bacterium]